MEFQDYYHLLGVSKNATPEEIKKQYRRLAKKYHPDVSKEKDAEKKFKEMKEAYEVLKDPEKRKVYDQMGDQFKQGESFTPPPNWQYQTGSTAHQRSHDTESDFSDFFESLFGRQRQSQPHFQQSGQDQYYKIHLSLEDAFHGTQKTITLIQNKMNKSTGHIQKTTRQLNIKIPAGVTQGQHIRLSGQGNPGLFGGKNGDLYLEILLEAHPFYSVDKKDIYLNVPITPWEAALGEKIQVPTLGGGIVMTLPKNTQTGQKIRLKGRGLPGQKPGDQFVILAIHNPEPKTEAEETLFKKMKAEMPFNPRKTLFPEHQS